MSRTHATHTEFVILYLASMAVAVHLMCLQSTLQGLPVVLSRLLTTSALYELYSFTRTSENAQARRALVRLELAHACLVLLWPIMGLAFPILRLFFSTVVLESFLIDLSK